MASGTCDACGRDEYMPFVCKFCKGRFCAAHRLPENHNCQGLGEWREKVRSEGRLMQPEPDLVAPQVSRGAAVGSRLDALFARVDGKLSYVFLGIFILIWLASDALIFAGRADIVQTLFILDRNVLTHPWVIITSVFAHIEPNHIFLNGLVFFFMAPTVERLIGSKRFAILFVGGGALAGIAQLLVFSVWLPTTGIFSPAISASFANEGILGASGGIMALFGCLAFLAPRLTVLVFFIIPAPLWLITVFYALFDIVGLTDLSSNIAHIAHLAGLALGLLYGQRLRAQGLRVMMQPRQHLGPQPGRP
ncbi:MAG: rhomboid family intramembrane serine protease [Thermoplasmatota archaeon]